MERERLKLLKYLYHRPTIGQAMIELLVEFMESVEDGVVAMYDILDHAREEVNRRSRDKEST